MKQLASALLLALAFAAPSPEMRYFQYQRPIQNLSPAPAQVCLPLAPGIFSHAAPGLADLRLYRNQAETPWAMRTAESVAASQQSIAPLNLGQRNGQTVFDAAMPEGNFSDITLSIAGDNFLATVEVSGSNEQSGNQTTRLGSFTIFDLTSQKLGRSTVLHLPQSNFRFLHFRIDGPIPSEKIVGLSVERVSGSQPKFVQVAESSHPLQKSRATVIEFTVPANTPVDRIVFVPAPASATFSRQVTVSSLAIPAAPNPDNPEPAPTLLSSGDILRLHRIQNGHRIDEERLALDTSASTDHPAQKWTVQIDNGDDDPIPLQSVRLEMLERDLCFESAAPAGYTLMYGDPALAAPQYDYQRLFDAQPNSVQGVLGPEQSNPGHQPRPDSRPFTDKHPALLWAALIAVLLLLGAIAYRSARPATPPPPPAA